MTRENVHGTDCSRCVCAWQKAAGIKYTTGVHVKTLSTHHHHYKLYNNYSPVAAETIGTKVLKCSSKVVGG